MNFILSLIMPFIYFSFSNFTTCILFKNKFGRCLPITFMINITILYLSQLLFKTFNIGYIILLVYALVSIVLYVISKNKKQVRNDIFTGGYLSFGIFYLLSFIICFHKNFNQYDELMHWGVMVKEMLRNDKFYTDVSSTLMYHKDYPPFASLFEMLWCKVGFGYSEANVTIALHTFIFSLSIHHLFDNDNKIKLKSVLRNFVIALCIFTVILSFDVFDLFSSIYLEILLPSIFAFCFYTIMTEEDNLINKITFILSCITLMMTKQIGIAFFGLLLLTYFFKRFIFSKEKSKFKNLAFLMFTVIITLGFYFSWSRYVSNFDIVKQFSIDKVSSISDIFGPTGYGKEVVRLFVKALFETRTMNNNLYISYVGCSIILTIIFILLYTYFKKKLFAKEEKNNIITSIIVFSTGTICYAAMMLGLYLFVFSKGEALKLASYNRYMASYVLAEFLAITLVYSKLVTSKCKTKNILIGLLIGLVLMNNRGLKNFVPAIFRDNTFSDMEEYAKEINKNVPENKRVFVISKGLAHDHVLIHYYSSDKFMAFSWDNYLTANYNNEKTREKLENQLFEYDYIYIIDLSDNFISNFSKYLDEETKFKKGKIYKVTLDKRLEEV